MTRKSFSLKGSLSTCIVDRVCCFFAEALRICSVNMSSDHPTVASQGNDRQSPPQFISYSTWGKSHAPNVYQYSPACEMDLRVV